VEGDSDGGGMKAWEGDVRLEFDLDWAPIDEAELLFIRASLWGIWREKRRLAEKRFVTRRLTGKEVSLRSRSGKLSLKAFLKQKYVILEETTEFGLINRIRLISEPLCSMIPLPVVISQAGHFETFCTTFHITKKCNVFELSAFEVVMTVRRC
jgi:hypothetical protein